MAREGWHKLRPEDRGYKAGAERYRDPSGSVVSRRQYDNARYTEAGWRSRAEFERRHNDPTYSYLVKKIADNKHTTRRAIDTPTSGIARNILLPAKRSGYGKERVGRGPRGPMAKALVAAGLRDPNATYAVGATPPRSSR